MIRNNCIAVSYYTCCKSAHLMNPPGRLHFEKNVSLDVNLENKNLNNKNNNKTNRKYVHTMTIHFLLMLTCFIINLHKLPVTDMEGLKCKIWGEMSVSNMILVGRNLL